jgi:pimeloyl-ACP methyl ester carboxylesterase
MADGGEIAALVPAERVSARRAAEGGFATFVPSAADETAQPAAPICQAPRPGGLPPRDRSDTVRRVIGTLDRPGGALSYEVIDATPRWRPAAPLIVFHHGIGATAEIWADWLPALVDRYRIARFDTLGFGRSARPGPGHPWSLDGLAEDVCAVAGAAGGGPFHLVGESLGGTVGLALAARRPGALLSLTVSNASHRGGSIQRARQWREFIGAHGMAAWAEMMTPLRLDRERVSEGQWRWFERAQALASPDAVLDLADLLIGADLSPLLSAIAVPTLLLAPAQSPFVPLAVMEQIHAAIPGSELQVFTDARHGLPCSHGDACGRALRSFLDRRGARGA